MSSHQAKSRANKAPQDVVTQQKSDEAFSFEDHRPETVQLKHLQHLADNSSQIRQLKSLQTIIQRKANNTGLPNDLKSGIENLSGHSMDDVKVHYNSAKPAGLQAHAYAQGSDIHLAPGQEKHLPHEAWHVVQQKQGRVKPTMQLKKGIAVNDDDGLEKEADEMGRKAIQLKQAATDVLLAGNAPVNSSIVQRAALVNADHMHSGGSWTSSKVGGKAQKVVAKKLKLKSGGSFPGSAHNSPSADPPSWTWLKSNSLGHPDGPPNYVRMHLLNGRMGGPGNDADNLAPGSASLNSHHWKNMEEEAITWMTRGGEIDEYQVELTYNGASVNLKSANGKAAWKDTIFNVKGHFKYTDNTNKQHTANFEGEEDAAVDTKANWTAH